MRVLLWFHRDLRTHDHSGLNWAIDHGHEVIALVFAPSRNSSSAKLKFFQETATDLATNLKTAGIDLEISDESPLSKIPELVATHKIEKIITHQRMNYRDQNILEEVSQKLSIEVIQMGDLTLFDIDVARELSLAKLRPFTAFKNYVVANFKVPDSLARSSAIKLTTPSDSHWSIGGETAGLARLQDYLWESRACLHYHETRNGMIERDDSSKFSRWLALGCLSPRTIYYELKRLEEETGPSPGISGLIYELIWRDYFKFLALLMKESFFSRQGLKASPLDFTDNNDLVEYWKKGETGEDFVDANLRELSLTGWMSNRGRQNVASYFAKTAHLDWTLGASWFENQLIDDDPENNWGNWQYLAGVGTDPRDRRFDVRKQASTYDPEGLYQDQWLEQCRTLETKIMQLLTQRSQESTICPSEVLTPENKNNKTYMEEARSAARRLYSKGLIDFYQKGVKVNPLNAKGPIHLKLRGK